MKFPYALLLALASCVNHNLDNSTGQSLRAAATFCQKPAGEMEWFQLTAPDGNRCWPAR